MDQVSAEQQTKGDDHKLIPLNVVDLLTPEERDSEADRIKITQLHESIYGKAKTTLEDAICIGEILTERKKKCGHGKWIPWLKKNAPFTEATACRYMRCYKLRDRFKSKSVLDLSEVYRLLTVKEVKKDELGNVIEPASKRRGEKSLSEDAAKAKEPQKPPKERSLRMTQKAVSKLDLLWYRNDNGRTLPKRSGELQRWVGKVEVVRAETAETIAKEAFRLW